MTVVARKRRALELIWKMVAREGFPPSIRELDKKLGINSQAVTMDLVQELEQEGLLERSSEKARAMRVTKKGENFIKKQQKQFYAPLFGITRGGPLRFAQQHLEKMVPVPEEFKRLEKRVFLLKIEGDSMVGAGIHDQDLVIIKSQPTADPGDIILARYGGETTVKRFVRKDGRVFLMPENRKYKPIEVKRGDDYEIQGKVVGIIRKNDG